ncbi:MAG: hypothetical protein HYX27_08900 [Acidobacteria bacterium]|nr:hypothetical protein [Acidobacteriota bacterium]
MPETLEKLRPDRDLQVYFERPSAIAAMSGATPNGFTASGTWRQQFDWCVIEWNRENVFEHPRFRNLPDGNLSGLTLTYEETRDNCIPMDSDLYPTVDWPYLRVWADDAGVETFYQVKLRDYATPIAGSYVAATATFELKGTPNAGDIVGLAWMGENYKHDVAGGDTLTTIAGAIVASINAASATMTASNSGAAITLTSAATGANGNTVGAYGTVSGSANEYWEPAAATLGGGVSPAKWRVVLPLGALTDKDGHSVPMTKVRKMRWTYAAAMQTGAYVRSEFAAVVSNWSVTGANRGYRAAGPGSRRLEDDHKKVSYYGSHWMTSKGNFSGGTIHSTATYGESVTIPYHCPQTHELYLGTRLLTAGADIALRVDTETPRVISLRANGEDALMRVPLGQYGPGDHSVLVSHNGPGGYAFYFDFLEVAIPAATVSDQPVEEKVTLATDWDTDHSIALPAERTAWMIHSLGFRGRVNHYVGALWFYELYRKEHQYASATVDFTGTPTVNDYTDITIGRVGEPGSELVVRHLNLYGDTAATICKAFELEFNRGYTAIRAVASGTRLTIYARAMGDAGESVSLGVSPASGAFALTKSASNLTGGEDGSWYTDTEADPRINRACRDWSRGFFSACKSYGLDVTAAFSLELQHGDPSPEAGIGQRYSTGAPCLLNTPALQTNFSPVSRAYWEKVHLEMADILAAAGHVPYLQFGEVQWWYFPNMEPFDTPISMPYYDQYTKDQFKAGYGFPLRFIGNNAVNPADFPEEAAFLPTLIGQFTDAVRAHVLAAHPNCRFEVLYPTDVNDTAWGHLVNYPNAAWTPAKLNSLKTESFGFTFSRDLNKSKYSINYGVGRGFQRNKRSFLVGPGDSSTTWEKEARIAKKQNLESIVLFALDQFCLIGYPVPFWKQQRRSRRF